MNSIYDDTLSYRKICTVFYTWRNFVELKDFSVYYLVSSDSLYMPLMYLLSIIYSFKIYNIQNRISQ